MSAFWKGVWAELTGSAQRRREYNLVREIVLRDAVCQIRRLYLPQPPSGSPEYDKGYGDAVLDITRLLDPDSPSQ